MGSRECHHVPVSEMGNQFASHLEKGLTPEEAVKQP